MVARQPATGPVNRRRRRGAAAVSLTFIAHYGLERP